MARPHCAVSVSRRTRKETSRAAKGGLAQNANRCRILSKGTAGAATRRKETRQRERGEGMSGGLTPHDESFRKVFGDPDLARQLIEHYLPDSVHEQLDLTVLSAESESFVDDKLKNRQGDVLFRTRLKEGGDALVYILLEHKSSPDRWVALQLVK